MTGLATLTIESIAHKGRRCADALCLAAAPGYSSERRGELINRAHRVHLAADRLLRSRANLKAVILERDDATWQNTIAAADLDLKASLFAGSSRVEDELLFCASAIGSVEEVFGISIWGADPRGMETLPAAADFGELAQRIYAAPYAHAEREAAAVD
jgi:hypothetical protein